MAVNRKLIQSVEGTWSKIHANASAKRAGVATSDCVSDFDARLRTWARKRKNNG